MNSSKNTTLRNAKNLKRGDPVKAVVFSGGVRNSVFWELDGDTAYISSPGCYQRMLEGDSEARPTGFLVSDLVLDDE